MKRLFTALIFLLVLSAPAFAWMTPMMCGGGTPAVVGGCMSGTYNFAIDFDHPSGSDYACDSGGTPYQKDASGGTYQIDAAYGQSGNGFRADALDEYIQWDNDFTIDVVDAGTIWVGVYMEAQSAADPYVIEIFQDANNYVRLRINNGTAPAAEWAGNATADSSTWSGTALSNATWYRVGMTWDQDLGTNDFCVNVNSGTWECDTDSLEAWTATDAIKLVIGENNFGATEDDFRIDDVIYIDGFQVADPHGNY